MEVLEVVDSKESALRRNVIAVLLQSRERHPVLHQEAELHQLRQAEAVWVML